VGSAISLAMSFPNHAVSLVEQAEKKERIKAAASPLEVHPPPPDREDIS